MLPLVWRNLGGGEDGTMPKEPDDLGGTYIHTYMTLYAK